MLHRTLFSLLLILLPTQLGFHFWPEWAFVLGRRVDYLSPTVYLTDFIIVSMLVSWLYANPKSEIRNPKQIQNHKFKFLNWKTIAFVVCFVGINIYIASNPWVAVYKWFKVLEFVCLGLYVVSTKPRLSAVVFPLSVGVLYSSVIAITQFLLQRSIGGPLWFLGERTFDITTPGIARWEGFGRLLLRPYATFPHPNVLGGYIATMLPLLIVQLSNYPIIKFSNKIFYALIMLFACIALVITFSRSAWVAGAFGIGITYYVLWRTQSKRPLFFPSVIRHTLPMLFVIFVTVSAALSLPLSSDESFMRRVELNRAAIAMWRASPIAGVGLGNFLVELPSYDISRLGNYLQPVHNIYLLVLAETGVVGFIVFVVLMAHGMRGFVLRITDRKKKFVLHTMIYLISFATFLVLGLFDHYSLTLQQGQLLFTLLIAFLVQ